MRFWALFGAFLLGFIVGDVFSITVQVLPTSADVQGAMMVCEGSGTAVPIRAQLDLPAGCRLVGISGEVNLTWE